MTVGVHCLKGGPGSDRLLSAGMKVIKYVNSAPPANLPEDVIVIWRWVENPDNINDQFNTDPVLAARAWVNKQRPRFQDIPKFAYIEGPNENNCEDLWQASWYSQFELERMRLMKADGRKACIGNFGTGRPPLPSDDGGVVWTALMPMLRYAKQNGHLLGLHEYNYDLDTWNILRYRRVYDFLPLDARPYLVITEWGLDGNRGAFRDPGWRWQHPNPDAAYMALIRAYDAEMDEDNYALGFCIFTLGDDGHWGRFDIAGQPVFNLLEQYLKEESSMALEIGKNARVGVESANIRTTPGGGAVVGTVRYGDRAVVVEGPQNGWYRLKEFNGWVREITDRGIRVLYPPGVELPRRWEKVVVGTGKIKVPSHKSIPHTYRSLHPLVLMSDDPHWKGITDEMGLFDYDRSEWVDGIRYYQVNNGKGHFGGTLWIPCKDGDVSLEITPNTTQPDCNSLVLPDNPVPLPPETPPVTWPEPPPIPAGINIAGPTFENGHTTDDKGNQIATGYSFWYTRQNGEVMPFPTKHQDNSQGTATEVVPARAMGWGEYILKPESQLPPNERNGADRAIILDGTHAFKGMGNIAQAFKLSRKFTGTPGTTATLVVHISAESQDIPRSRVHPGKLEDDHMVVGVKWGTLPQEVRTYADMIKRRDVRLLNGQIVDRPWNRFVLTTTFPQSGELVAEITGQNNWPRTFPDGGNDIFIDDIRVIVGSVEPPLPPPPPPGELDLTKIIEALQTLRGVYDIVNRDVENLRFTLDSLLVIINELSDAIEELQEE